MVDELEAEFVRPPYGTYSVLGVEDGDFDEAAIRHAMSMGAEQQFQPKLLLLSPEDDWFEVRLERLSLYETANEDPTKTLFAGVLVGGRNFNGWIYTKVAHKPEGSPLGSITVRLD